MKYAGTLVAPYWRFRRVVGGLAADVTGCHWTCERCSTRYGWWSVPPRYELEPQAVRERVDDFGARSLLITGGEPGLYWRHVVEVARLCIADGVAFTVETAGLIVGAAELDALAEATAVGGALEAKVVIGVKASDGARLADLTGQPLAVAERAHARQMAAVEHAITRLPTKVTLLDRYTDRATVIALHQRGIEVEVIRWFRMVDPHRFYRAKRFRKAT